MRRRWLALTIACIASGRLPAHADENLETEWQAQLIVSVAGTRGALAALRARPEALAAEGLAPRELFELPHVTGDECPGPEAGAESARRLRVYEISLPSVSAAATSRTAAEGWNAAHRLQRSLASQPGVAEGSILYTVEPDLQTIDHRLERILGRRAEETDCATGAVTHRITQGIDAVWPSIDRFDWYLERTQLARGRALVEQTIGPNTERVRIAHLDTGYPEYARGEDAPDRVEPGLPPRLDIAHSWSFSECPGWGKPCVPTPGAVDRTPEEGLLRNRGHGTATLAILAGGTVHVEPCGLDEYEGPLGGAPFADVVEYRIANSVVIWRPSRVMNAIAFTAQLPESERVDVVSMSMGGIPSVALLNTINDAYCRGVAIVTAAGNHMRYPALGKLTPSTTVYPARYSRVISVTGATAAGLAYAERPRSWRYWLSLCRLTMLGNAGPGRVMKESMAGRSPNVPWLQLLDSRPQGSVGEIHLDGAGTSAATPQVAAAAAQWLQYHREDPELKPHWREWQKAEAAFWAVLDHPLEDDTDPAYVERWFGRGMLGASPDASLPQPWSPEPRHRAKREYGWLVKLLLESARGPSALHANETSGIPEEAYATEIAQRAVVSEELGELLADSDEAPPEATQKQILAFLAEDRDASDALRAAAKDALAQLD